MTEETVHVHSVAADPGGGAVVDERPDEGYASEELDELGGFIDAPGPVDERDESADAELEQQDLEELEQQLAGVVVQAAPGTAASAEAAADAAIKKLRRDQKHNTPPSKTQKAAETKAGKEATAKWVQDQWVARPMEPPPAGAPAAAAAAKTVPLPAQPAFVPPSGAPRRKKRDKDGKETEELEPADQVKDFEAAYRRPPTEGGPTLKVDSPPSLPPARPPTHPLATCCAALHARPACHAPSFACAHRILVSQVLKKLSSKAGAFAFWSLFIGPALLGVMTKNSNAYAVSMGAGADYYKEFTPFAQLEIEKCIGLLYRNGLAPVPDLDLMFADPRERWAYGDTRVRGVLGPNSIRRFKMFRALFHIQHPTENRFMRYN